MPFLDWTPALEAELTDATDASTTDDEINQRAVLTRERAKVEHNWGTSGFEAGYSDDGRHCPGSARVFLQSTTPNALRRPDNTANQSGASSTITAVKDQGRLWADTAGGNTLWVYSAVGSWQRVAAPGTNSQPFFTTSSDATAIPSGSTVTLGSWGTPLSVAVPGAGVLTSGTFQLMIEAVILVTNTGTNDRYCRVGLNKVLPGASKLVTKELLVPQRISASFPGMVEFRFMFNYSPTVGATSTFEFVAEANTGSDLAFGAGACNLTGDGAANRAHSWQHWLYRYA